MSHPFGLRVGATLVLLCLASRPAHAEILRITSRPSGATVELDSIPAGTTPFEKDFPGGYFHKTRTAIGARLEHPMVARITLAGYATKEILLSQGPMTWIGLNGRHHGDYWLLKADRFDVDLDALDDVFTGSITRVSRHASTKVEDELPLEDLIAKAKSSVVHLRGVDKAGTGFFITQTGVIATNAHVARNEEALPLVMSGGIQLDAKVIYVDDEFRIALVKVAGNGFPYLPLADTSTVRQGDSVFAIGNPGDGMQFSVTKRIVSNVGPFPSAGRGTWIQADAQMNPGNSGGPLLNARGEVIGISTQKVTRKNVSGFSFALSAGDLLSVLQKFYHDEPIKLSASAAPTRRDSSGVGFVVVPGPTGETVSVDGERVGLSPVTLILSSGFHTLSMTCRGHVPRTETIKVLEGSTVKFGPVPWCEKQQ
jgi:S1-C subfamily serine protease